MYVVQVEKDMETFAYLLKTILKAESRADILGLGFPLFNSLS
jgi:hypothetical protein